MPDETNSVPPFKGEPSEERAKEGVSNGMTRDEHLDWAKNRALEYVNAGDLQDAFASMISDLNKHDELRNHVGIMLGAQMKFSGFLSTAHDMRHWIEGFN